MLCYAKVWRKNEKVDNAFSPLNNICSVQAATRAGPNTPHWGARLGPCDVTHVLFSAGGVSLKYHVCALLHALKICAQPSKLSQSLAEPISAPSSLSEQCDCQCSVFYYRLLPCSSGPWLETWPSLYANNPWMVGWSKRFFSGLIGKANETKKKISKLLKRIKMLKRDIIKKVKDNLF